VPHKTGVNRKIMNKWTKDGQLAGRTLLTAVGSGRIIT